MADKRISELPLVQSLGAGDTSLLIKNGVDYQFSIGLLLEYIAANLSFGAAITFGSALPQNTSGKNGDVFLKTTTGQFAQKISGSWVVVYTPVNGTSADGTLLYGSGIPGSGIGKNTDTYIDTLTGIFYLRSDNAWTQVFSMQTGPQGPRGEKGDTGSAGAAGRSVLNGTSNPSNTNTGANGDFYINTNTLRIFGPKAAGDWGTGISLVGLQGEKGDQGDAGPKGDKGDAGAGLAQGGTTGQVLKKLSGADYATTWADNGFASLTGQPADNTNLGSALSNKVDKQEGYALSQANFTPAEKTKLANLSEHFKGKFTSLLALQTAYPTAALGDYATIDTGTGADSRLYMWDGDDNTWVMSSGGSSGGATPDATETSPGLVELATVAEALARTDDQRAMTALKTIALILDEKKKVSYQINPIGVNEVSILMENAGQVNSVLIVGAASPKLKIGQAGTYFAGTQNYPFPYAAGDRVFITYNYSDLNQASCNIKLKCQDN